VRWEYGYQPEAGTPEADLTETWLKPRDWLRELAPAA
jgi:coproporphyrinogen III oxidase